MSRIPNLVYADEDGNIYPHPHLKMSVRSGTYDMLPYDTELIKLPPSSRLYFLPLTTAVAYDENKSTMVDFEDGLAVSVFLPPGYLRLFLPSYKKKTDYTMPLFAYTAVGELDGDLVVPAIKVDDDSRWRPSLYDFSDNFEKKVDEFLSKVNKNNRLYEQIKTCALKYHCTAAKNVFYPRWECPIPTSPSCNASCVGCISLQTDSSCVSSQDRLNFIPTASEIAEVALNHYEIAKDPIISFGQGCEGDPILQTDVIVEAVKIIKRAVPNLTVNFNSNCSIPENIDKLINAGVDSFRVSTISFIEDTYNAYYRPRKYTLEDVKKSMEYIRDANRYLQLNLLTCPGLNDRNSEADELINVVKEYKVDLIQTRNLNIDTNLLFSKLAVKSDEIYGIKNMLKRIKKESPTTLFGYFNRMAKDFHKDRMFPDLRTKRYVSEDPRKNI